ncbi:TPA: XRE family transcriptional regulator [Candidatus Gastranaerophilales bacterium HUM_20]|nr:helix-turn-helix domain protein [Clostridium sp. CAG:729]DAB22126.1 MAG TPA: XRE family transcriptional regulator [Candidatus Gastranaerophilales bacterium HUM_20]
MNAEIKKLLCLRIKNFRESTKLSQEKFCEKAEIDVRTMSNIENCRSFPSFETVCSIINAYKLEPNKLLDFIKYDKTEEDALDLLILEYLKKCPDGVKRKVVDLLEELK